MKSTPKSDDTLLTFLEFPEFPRGEVSKRNETTLSKSSKRICSRPSRPFKTTMTKPQVTRGRDENLNIPSKAGSIDWLAVLRSTENTCEIQDRVLGIEEDEPILAQLKDINLKLNHEGETKSVFTGFTLNFVFGPNDYFDNEVLTVDFYVRADAELPIKNIGDDKELQKFRNTKGCTINWKPNKKPKALVTATQGGPRGVGGYDIYDSFFTFFDPPTLNDKTVRKIFRAKSPKYYEDFKYIMNGWNYCSYCVHYTIGFVLATEVIPDAKKIHGKEVEKAFLEKLPFSDDNRFIEI